jgi:hypothetical protein
MPEKAPLPVTDQWSESRGFARLYHNNPHYQARLAMTLCGLRAEIIQKKGGDEEDPDVKIINSALKEFGELHPEFLSPQPREDSDPELRLGAYEPDPLLIQHMERITDHHE